MIVISGNFYGSPKRAADSHHVISYSMTPEQTLANRRASPEPGNDTPLVSVDILSGAKVEVPAGAGVKFNPAFVGATVGYEPARGSRCYHLHQTGGQSRHFQLLPGSSGVLIEYYARFNFTGTCRSRISNNLESNNLQLVPVVGLEPTRLFMVPGF